MIPSKKDEKIDDYLTRLAEISNENNEDEFPKLSIEEENEFKRIKLSLEHDAVFPDYKKFNLPPEIESQFLDNIFDFEEKYKNAKQITVYEKIGKPAFKNAELLNEEELEIELSRLEDLLEQHEMGLDVLCDYENETKLIYKFITEELFKHEIDDVEIPGMVTHFTYEEFHQNHKYEIENGTEDLLTMFFDKKHDFYERFHSDELQNYLPLNNFRTLFKKFKIKKLSIKKITFDEEVGKCNFDITFWAKIKGTESKITYSGNGSLDFKYEYGCWNPIFLNLPIND